MAFSDKLSFLIGLESSLFLSIYLMDKDCISIDDFADSVPVVKFPNDDIYIHALLVKLHLQEKAYEKAGRSLAILSESINRIKQTVEHQLFDEISDGGCK